MDRIIQARRSLIVAADVPSIRRLGKLVEAARDMQGVGAFKLGFSVGLEGLREAVSVVRSELGRDFPVIYDAQKAATDIPATGTLFAQALRRARVNAAILFPFTGPATQEAWTNACLGEGLKVIVGGIMTHEKFLVSEGGYIDDSAVECIYRNACKQGVRDFVVPGTKINWVQKIYSWLVEELGEGNFTLYAPGFVTQGGDISECGAAAGENWHVIVGSGIHKKQRTRERRSVMKKLCRQIVV